MTAGSDFGRRLSRRAFMGFVAGAALSTAVGADELVNVDRGVFSDGSLQKVARKMAGVGAPAGAKVSILVSPQCRKGDDLFETIREMNGSVPIRWIPFGWRESDDGAVAYLLEKGDEAIQNFLTTGNEVSSDPSYLWLASRQREMFDREAFRLLSVAVGRTPASPTVLVAIKKDETRIYRGAPDRKIMKDIKILAGYL